MAKMVALDVNGDNNPIIFRVIESDEIRRNPGWHDRKQVGKYMVVGDDDNYLAARYNPDNDGADSWINPMFR